MGNTSYFSHGDSEDYPTNGYVRVPYPKRLIEPIDDYDLETFNKWLELYSDYFMHMRDIQIKNGVGYYGTAAYKKSLPFKGPNPLRRPPRRNYTKRRPHGS